MRRMPPPRSTARRCAGRGRCRSSASCSPSRPGRCCSRESGTATTASSPSSGARSRVAPLAALLRRAGRDRGLRARDAGEYLSFIVLLFALYVVAGGILVTGNLRGTPLVNTAILAFGTADRELVGTTGAAMILIRPLLARQCGAAAQRPRRRVLHLPGRQYRRRAVAARRSAAVRRLPARRRFLLDHAASLARDRAGCRRSCWRSSSCSTSGTTARTACVTTVGESRPPINLGVSGSINLLLIAGIIAAILASATWKPGISFDVYGTRLELQNLVRDGVLVLIAILSLVLTPNEHREANGFTWEPIAEVAILFAGIFTCIIPVLAMLACRQGRRLRLAARRRHRARRQPARRSPISG